MGILIAGGTGFIGRCLSEHLLRQGENITLLTRDDSGKKKLPKGVKTISGNPVTGEWEQTPEGFDTVINLTGASIFFPWTRKRKDLITQTRVQSTRNLVAALDSDRGNRLFVNASAVGIYGFSHEEQLTESSHFGEDYLARVCREWEREAAAAEDHGVRTVLVRFGVVLGKGGGALSKMLPLYKMGLGGVLGNGRQWMSWIHVEDAVNAIQFLIQNPSCRGPYNLCSPHPVRNRELNRVLSRQLRRPAFFRVPAPALRLVLREGAQMLLRGQRAVPQKLIEQGFKFSYPELSGALADLLD